MTESKGTARNRTQTFLITSVLLTLATRGAAFSPFSTGVAIL